MTYKQANAAARRCGAKHATGLAYLAIVADVVCFRHVGINPKGLYEAAKRAGIGGRELAQMASAKDAPIQLTNLLFAE